MRLVLSKIMLKTSQKLLKYKLYFTMKGGNEVNLQERIEKRTLEEANYIIETGATIRKTAETFGISKSTVHKDITYKLKNINYELYKEVSKVINNNLLERATRGGTATKEKYMKLKCKNIKNTYKDNVEV